MSDHPLLDPLNAGIEFDHLPGCIPILTEVGACHASGYRYFHDWQELTGEQQAFLIGAYLAERQLKVHLDDAEAREMKRRSKK